MSNKLVLTYLYYKVGFAIIVCFAIFYQLLYLHLNMMLNAANFFSFFTIESNIFAAIMLLVSSWCIYNDKQGRYLTYLRGAATLYMVVTGIIYSVLLAGADVQTPLPFVNTILHYVFPIVMIIDWLADPPKDAIPLKVILLWLGFPLAYVIYSLVRGSLVSWYPYPFLDVASRGYQSVFLTCIILAVCIAALSWAIAYLGTIPGRIYSLATVKATSTTPKTKRPEHKA